MTMIAPMGVTNCQHGGLCPMKQVDTRKSHPWENLSKGEKRAQYVWQAYRTEASDHRTFTTE